MADETINLEVKSNLGDVSKDAQNAAGDLKIMGVSLNGIKAGFTSAMGAAKSMFSSVKAGLITSGIGGVFPFGYRVGIISEILDSADNEYLEAKVDFSSDPLVIDFFLVSKEKIKDN